MAKKRSVPSNFLQRSLFDPKPVEPQYEPAMEKAPQAQSAPAPQTPKCPKCGREDVRESVRERGMFYCVVCTENGDNFYFKLAQ